jgi:hypothetical protein
VCEAERRPQPPSREWPTAERRAELELGRRDTKHRQTNIVCGAETHKTSSNKHRQRHRFRFRGIPRRGIALKRSSAMKADPVHQPSKDALELVRAKLRSPRPLNLRSIMLQKVRSMGCFVAQTKDVGQSVPMMHAHMDMSCERTSK